MAESREAQRLDVAAGAHAYTIHFGGAAERALNAQTRALRDGGSRFAVITDSNVARVQGNLLDRFACEPLVLPAGEPSKSTESVARAWDWLCEARLDRTGSVFAVGGGVIGDLAGFAAATYLRGIRYFQVPTSLLAMVDSSVGGKTGINTGFGKNLVGAFWQPSGVFAVTDVLHTLPAREFAAGMAEVIKYGMLADRPLFDRLAKAPEPLQPGSAGLPEVIRRCCELKTGIVAGDERETASTGGRALLNLGHTFAHAIENTAGYGTYVHGEAVAIGLLMACRLSEELELPGQPVSPEVAPVLARYNLPLRLREPLAIDSLMAAMERDKKVRDQRLRFVVLESIGRAVTHDRVPEALIRELWSEFGAT